MRVPLESLTPFLTVGYGDHAFKLSGANRAALVLPDTEYKYVRAVVGAQVPLASGVSVAASGGLSLRAVARRHQDHVLPAT